MCAANCKLHVHFFQPRKHPAAVVRSEREERSPVGPGGCIAEQFLFNVQLEFEKHEIPRSREKVARFTESACPLAY